MNIRKLIDLNFTGVLCLFVVACSHSPEKKDSVSTSSLTLPSANTKMQMVTSLKDEIDRIDGEGLLPRSNRPESWDKTIQRLKNEAATANTAYDLGRVFKRLDATYPNLHAKVFLIPELDERATVGSVQLPFKFYAERIDRQNNNHKYFLVVNSPSKGIVQNGDELLEINSAPIQKWSDENFIFCKFPFRQQCETEFFDNFKNELLGWNRHQPLELKIKRGAQILSVSISPEVKPNTQNPDEDNSNFPCGVRKGRYKGFVLAYEGQHLCAFESPKQTKTVVIRIDSFRYEDVPFAVLDGEVQIFWNNYWRQKSPIVSTLILDVIGNHGGQSPIPYYGLFYSQPYQEQYVQFKKIKEFEQQEILESLFWGDKGKEIWFENIKKDGSFGKTQVGEFLGHIPQFCSDRHKDCREGLFAPRKNNFSGKVKLLMDHWCISSCVGFVSNIKTLLKDRVQTFGSPDSGDSAYSRLSIFVNPQTTGKVETKIAPLKKARTPDKPEPWVRQVVAATRSTDKDGKIISGTPQGIDVWVPRLWNQTYEEWESEVFKAAM
ncbi:MAG: hypothetical protein ACXVCY_14265 [Pseudobdellovibrionaceae bacterium]